MNINDQKEAFSEAYARAIASVAGFICNKGDFDRNSVDISFASATSPFASVEVQLKSTSNAHIVTNLNGNEIHFPLPIKNYNDLRAETIMPRILVALLLPEKPNEQAEEYPEQWISQTPEQLALLKCAYWINLNGMAESNNQATVTITIPMDDAHIFKPSVLNNLINQVVSLRTGGNNAV
ncbi:MAG: DUF4365 domain-containing protein [Fibromonadaceae bacterium]|jgi:hypothetical protein|nr:DUF4365 domain-containing protein [Fibromonadaceae bacterium]